MRPPARITESFAVREVPGRSRGGRQLVRLLEPLEYHVGSADSDRVIVVPCGFETDFASIPFGLRNTFPPLGRHARAAIVHDFLYRVRGDTPGLEWILGPWGAGMLSADEIAAYQNAVRGRAGVNRHLYTRAEADDVFREAMAVVGVGVVTRNIMHRAVRTFGGGGWGS